MRLLVSVRSEEEVVAAVEGGADIVDAKEPAHGALGPVHPQTLAAISRALPAGHPLSLALGDPADEGAIRSAWSLLDAIAEPRPLFVKLGLAAAHGAAGARAALRCAAELADSSALRPALVAVAYADGVGPGAEEVTRLALETGASGVLLDTWHKDGRDLLVHLTEPSLRHWAARARGSGLLVALAGSLSLGRVSRVARLPVDVVGVRGAACVGGRDGRVEVARVRALATAMAGSNLRPIVIS